MQNYSTYNDEQLVALLKHSDSRAFGVLYDRYFSSLYNAAYKRLQDHPSCEDLVQEVFADLWLRRQSVDIENIAAYLHTAVRFQVLKTIEKQRRNKHFTASWATLMASAPGADAALREKELTRLLHDWLQTLPEARRQVFIKYFFHQDSSAEISVQLNISPKTVRNQLATAMHSMRSRLANFFSTLLY